MSKKININDWRYKANTLPPPEPNLDKELDAFIDSLESDELYDKNHVDFIDESILTDDQITTMNAVIKAMINGERKIILSGSAGVGKTFLVNYIIRKYHRELHRGNKAYITAPTNRAVSVLMDKDPEHPYYMNFSTIHKALYMKRVINEKNGEVYFKPDYKPRGEEPFTKGFIIIIDEASMLNSEILFYLENPDYQDIPMIFLGDNKQLNPVGEDHSPIFRRPSLEGKKVTIQVGEQMLTQIIPKYIEFSLTKIIRQAEDNPIIQLSMDLPRIGNLEPMIHNNMGYIYDSEFERLVKLVAQNEDARYLAWTNEAVDTFNLAARKELFYSPHKLQEGEIVIFSQPYEGDNGTVYSNGTEIKIRKLEIKEREFIALRDTFLKDEKEPVGIREKLSYYVINDDIKVIHESSEYDFLHVLNKIKSLTKKGLSWKKWFEFSEQFARVSYRYATTVHKAQGGTFDTIVVNMKDLNRNFKSFEKKRLWYTAITRAARLVIFFNEKNFYK